MNRTIDIALIRSLQKDIPILTAQIQALYKELDQKFGLHGAEVPITFGMEEDLLGSYTQAGNGEEEKFHFSLLFAGYSLEHPLSKEDRLDLYKHEYAHYMQYNMEIPREYTFQPGIHGSTWKYCCSLIGAVPTPYYRAGEALLKQDYDKVLKNHMRDKMVFGLEHYRRDVEYRKYRDQKVQYEIGDQIDHPKFGTGTIAEIEQCSGSVRLHIQFADELRKIDQKWLLRTKYKKKSIQGI